MFPSDLERDAFRSNNGEFGWTRAQVPSVIRALRDQSLGILGGELWWVPDGSTSWELPPPGVYVWESDRRCRESWQHFVERSAAEAITAVERCPVEWDIPENLLGRLLFNFTWTSEIAYPR